MKVVIGDPANIDGVMVEMGNHRFPNMGALYILGYLRQNLDGVELHYIRGDLGLDDYIRRLEEIKPDMYGISFASWVSGLAYKTINAVKERFPDLPIVCGGTHPTIAAEEVLQESRCDICAIGEGEKTALELVEHFFHKKTDLSQIQGIAYRSNGKVVTTPARKHIQCLEDIPLPAWDMVDIREYEGLGYCKKKPNTAMIFSRGCFYDCVYCSNPVWRSSHPWLRLRSPADIQKEIVELYSKGVREIWIRADEFNSDIKWALEVCKAIRELNYKDLYFECNLRADKVTDELAEAFKSINVWMINLGIESFNQRVLDGIKKKVTVEQIVDSCKALKRQGIDIYSWLMYYQIWEEDGKLCWETPDEVDHTLKMAKKMHGQGLIDLMSWQIATPMPGSELHDIAKRHNLINRKGGYNVWKVNMTIPGVDSRQVHIHRIKGMLLQAYMAFKKGRFNLKSIGSMRDRMSYILDAACSIVKSHFKRNKSGSCNE